MVELGKIFIKIGLDAKALEKGLIKATGRLKTFSKDITAVGVSLTKFVTLPILAVGVASLKMAASAQESESFFDVAFDGMADSVRGWSNQVAKSLGVSAFEIRENAATINVMAKSMGIAEDDAIEMAKGIAVLAQDLASFRDISPERAFEKLRAGITGEAEPLKQLGVLVDENTVKQAAWSAGIAENGKALTQTQKVAARWLVIQDQLSLANGDLIRTSQSLTNQSRRLTAGIGDLAREFGAILIPAATRIVQILNKLILFVRNLSPEVKKQIILWAGIAAAIGPAVIALGGIAGILPAIAAGLTTIVIPLVLIAAKALLLIGIFVGAIVLAKTFADDWTAAVDLLKAAFFKGFASINATITRFLKVGQFVVAQFSTKTAAKFQAGINFMEKVTKGFDTEASKNFQNAAVKIKASATDLVEGLKARIIPAVDALKAKLGTLTSIGAAPMGGVAPGGAAPGGGLSQGISAELAATKIVIDQFVSEAQSAFSVFGNTILDALFESGKNWRDIVQNALKQMLIAITKFVIKALAKLALLNILKITTGGVSGAVSAAGGVPGLAKGGIAKRPTIAEIGESGPEAVIPLGSNRASGILGGGEQTIMVFLDSRVLTETVVRGMPRVVRAQAGVRI